MVSFNEEALASADDGTDFSLDDEDEERLLSGADTDFGRAPWLLEVERVTDERPADYLALGPYREFCASDLQHLPKFT